MIKWNESVVWDTHPAITFKYTPNSTFKVIKQTDIHRGLNKGPEYEKRIPIDIRGPGIMKREDVTYFGAGPAALPTDVLAIAAQALQNYENTGM